MSSIPPELLAPVVLALVWAIAGAVAFVVVLVKLCSMVRARRRRARRRGGYIIDPGEQAWTRGPQRRRR